jgi:hypothetical protein
MCSAVANPSFHKRTFWAAATAGALFIAFLARQLLCLSAAGGPTGWWGQRRTGVFMRAGVERGLDRTCLKEAGLEGASISADGTCMATEGSSSGGWPIDVVRGASRAPTSLKQTASSMGCWRYRSTGRKLHKGVATLPARCAWPEHLSSGAPLHCRRTSLGAPLDDPQATVGHDGPASPIVGRCQNSIGSEICCRVRKRASTGPCLPAPSERTATR